MRDDSKIKCHLNGLGSKLYFITQHTVALERGEVNLKIFERLPVSRLTKDKNNFSACESRIQLRGRGSVFRSALEGSKSRERYDSKSSSQKSGPGHVTKGEKLQNGGFFFFLRMKREQ